MKRLGRPRALASLGLALMGVVFVLVGDATGRPLTRGAGFLLVGAAVAAAANVVSRP